PNIDRKRHLLLAAPRFERQNQQGDNEKRKPRQSTVSPLDILDARIEELPDRPTQSLGFDNFESNRLQEGSIGCDRIPGTHMSAGFVLVEGVCGVIRVLSIRCAQVQDPSWS